MDGVARDRLGGEDKIEKNLVNANKTPGIEDLEPIAWSGDHGPTLLERAPFESSVRLRQLRTLPQPLSGIALRLFLRGMASF
jgi:hypothetical protein